MTYTERPIAAFNPWLKGYDAGRGKKIAGVQLHSTRSGKSDGDDGPRTEGWWSNPANDQGGWGSYADCLIFEDGTRVICTDPDTEYPRYTAGYGYTGSWNASLYYYQIEIAQGSPTDPFTAAQVESAAQKCRELSLRYGFPLVRIAHLDQSVPPIGGIATHEDSDNGKIYGKSDPGPMFPWPEFFALALNEEDEMTPEQDKLLRDIAAALFGDLDPSTPAWDNLFERLKLIDARLTEIEGVLASGGIGGTYKLVPAG